jgi:hypothetical protein
MAGFMTGEEKARAKAVGVESYFRGKRFRTLKEEHIFKALDAGVETMKALNCPDPYNGKILAALAVALVRNDERSIGDMQQRKILAITEGNHEERQEFFELLSMEIAERYLAARKGEIPAETRITTPDSLIEKLEGVLQEMGTLGAEMSSVSALPDEMAVTIEQDMPDAFNIARGLIDGVVLSYESLVPQVNDEGELPNAVQNRAIAKAAFLRLSVEDLVEVAAENDLTGFPNKAALAKALSEVYEDDLDAVARITLRETGGDPAFGLITRLVPLSKTPDIETACSAFESLKGRYVEVQPAVFFVYRGVSVSDDKQFLTITGSIRSFFVSPVEVAGEVELNKRPRKDDVTIKLQEGQKWATVIAPRSSDLAHIGAILRRSGEISTTGSVAAPDPLDETPYNTWDSRSLWMLDLIRRDLQAPTLRLEETLMANFDSAKGDDPSADEEPSENDDEKVKPRLASVRLKGRKLEDHPEVCARIVGRAHLKDLEFRVRKVVDQATDQANYILVRLAWERDHLAVMTGASDDTIDADLHQRLVRLVRTAVERPLGLDLVPILKRIEKRSTEADVEADAEGVFDQTTTPPEPEVDAITLTAAEGVG